ncbi:endolytic transglycosylase MltG [Patescibacteria group bacterium]|nr:endolytic transglycosylase MltG [Patescibacteria group bacterium]
MRFFRFILKGVLVLGLFGSWLGWALFGPTGGKEVVFEVPQDNLFFSVPQRLAGEGLVKSALGYRWLAFRMNKGLDLEPGGYTLQGSLWAWEVADKLSEGPAHRWFTSYGCIRREQVGEALSKVFDWNQELIEEWEVLGKTGSGYQEGFYLPATYLISRDFSPEQISEMFTARFKEEFAPLNGKLRRSDLSLVEVVTIASLIQREAAGPYDMGLVSGVIHNRLDQEMKLQIDATMQYTLGKREDGGWWGSIDLSQKRNPSPFNTYLYKGLPPTPICSPGLVAMKFALEPQQTDCLFYLHDRMGQIHCAKTYIEHKANISKFL